MNHKNFYDTVLELPLFQGLSMEQLTEIFAKIPFSFSQFMPGEVILKPNEEHDKVTFVLSGRVRLVQPTYHDRVKVIHDFEAPFTLPFLYLFGVQNRSANHLEAVTEVGVMQVGKQVFLDMVQSNRIILVHVMNMLSTMAQRQHCLIDCMGPDYTSLRLATWLLAVSHHKAILTEVLADEHALCDMLHLNSSEFWRSVTILEGEHCVEAVNGRLKLIDRYGLNHFVNAKTGQ